jgi:phage tail-like protein
MSVTGFFDAEVGPPTAFYFSVSFVGMDTIDSSFQEVSGLKATFGIEEKKEGGENNYIHRLPTPPKFENLVLKQCLVPNSKLDAWCKDAINNFKFIPRDISIKSLSASDSKLLASWNVVHAFPISWEFSVLNSTTNQLAIESLTLNYRYFKRDI